MIRQALLRQVIFGVLLLTVPSQPACDKKPPREKRHAEPRPSHMMPKARPQPRPAVVVPKTPPGAPTTGDLLAFGSGSPELFDWRKTPVWADLSLTPFRLPSGTTSDVRKILKNGWGGPKAKVLHSHLSTYTSTLDGAMKLPACAPLRKTWTQTELILEHRSTFTLKMLQEALLLQARQHQQKGRSVPAVVAALAALRFACHMTYVPEMLMRLLAIRAEGLALLVLGELKIDAESCRKLQRTVKSLQAQRAPLGNMARDDWLMARSQLRMLTKGLTKTASADARARIQLRTLKRLILENSSTRYRRYSQLLRQGLATGRASDWKALDRLRKELHAGLAALKKKHGVTSSFDLAGVVAKLPNKPAAWTADTITKIFLGLITVRSAIWKRARLKHHANLATVKRLLAKKCR